MAEGKNQQVVVQRCNLVSGSSNSRRLCPLPDHITKQTRREEALLRDIFTLKGAKNGLDLLAALLEVSIQFLVISSLSDRRVATAQAEKEARLGAAPPH